MVSTNPFKIIVCSILFYGKWQHTPVTNVEMWQIDGWDIICMRIQTRVFNPRAVSFLSLDSFPFTFRFCKYLNDSIEENLKGDDRLSFKLIKKIRRSHLKRNHHHSVQLWHNRVGAKDRNFCLLSNFLSPHTRIITSKHDEQFPLITCSQNLNKVCWFC